jgi:hypothetical protein
VNLIKIDVVDLQPLKTLVDPLHDVRPRKTDLVVTRPHAQQHFGG